MIRAWVAGDRGASEASVADVLRVEREGGACAWLDLQDESDDAVRDALRPLGVHPVVVEDVTVHVNRPKVDDYTDYLYLVVHSARWEAGEARPSLRELDLVVGRHTLVSCHDGETRSIAAAVALVPKRPEVLARGPAYLLHTLLDVLVDNYLPIADRIAEEVDALEERVFEDPSTETYRRIMDLKRGIAAMRRILGPQRDTVMALTRDEFLVIPAEVRPYLRDVYDRLARVSDLLDSFRDEAASLLELHVSINSNRLNEVIKRLTVLATVGLPLTIVTSYYGMNLKLPEFEWAHGEWFALGLLLVTALATWLYLRWRRWD
jgi:magnesium transporter